MLPALSRTSLRHDGAMNPISITVYGIRNCDTVKKARAWLKGRGLPYEFHDFKTQGVPADRLDHWLAQAGWEQLLNRKGTTWRRLDPTVQATAQDERGARAVMLAHPSVIKRPVVEWGGPAAGDVSVGFKAELWATQRGGGK